MLWPVKGKIIEQQATGYFFYDEAFYITNLYWTPAL
jgi:hypothetical protein